MDEVDVLSFRVFHRGVRVPAFDPLRMKICNFFLRLIQSITQWSLALKVQRQSDRLRAPRGGTTEVQCTVGYRRLHVHVVHHVATCRCRWATWALPCSSMGSRHAKSRERLRGQGGQWPLTATTGHSLKLGDTSALPARRSGRQGPACLPVSACAGLTESAGFGLTNSSGEGGGGVTACTGRGGEGEVTAWSYFFG